MLPDTQAVAQMPKLVPCESWIRANRREIDRFPSASGASASVGVTPRISGRIDGGLAGGADDLANHTRLMVE